MIETHPFGSFVPKNARYLILGSFTAKLGDGSYNWFYGTKRNQFWPILENVYGRKFKDRNDKEKFFSGLGVAISDIIYQCERKIGSNLDANLINIVYNTKLVEKILAENKIEKIFFSSRFVETKFKKVFKHLVSQYPKMELVTLPSPSPRFAAMRLEEKIRRFKELLPR